MRDHRPGTAHLTRVRFTTIDVNEKASMLDPQGQSGVRGPSHRPGTGSGLQLLLQADRCQHSPKDHGEGGPENAPAQGGLDAPTEAGLEEPTALIHGEVGYHFVNISNSIRKCPI